MDEDIKQNGSWLDSDDLQGLFWPHFPLSGPGHLASFSPVSCAPIGAMRRILWETVSKVLPKSRWATPAAFPPCTQWDLLSQNGIRPVFSRPGPAGAAPLVVLCVWCGGTQQDLLHIEVFWTLSWAGPHVLGHFFNTRDKQQWKLTSVPFPTCSVLYLNMFWTKGNTTAPPFPGGRKLNASFCQVCQCIHINQSGFHHLRNVFTVLFFWILTFCALQ